MAGYGGVWGPMPWDNAANWWTAPGTALDPNDPEVYQRALLGQGRGGNQTREEQWYHDQFGRMQTTYGQMSLSGAAPQGYRFMDFLRDYGGNLAGQFASLTPRQRGEQQAPFQRLRWLT